VRLLIILASVSVAAPATATAQCYTARDGSPYDFTAAGGTLYQTDFSGDPLGDFPASLEFKQGAMEVARWNGRPALKASTASTFVIPLSAPLPQSFTVEVGVVNRNTKQVGAETIEIYGGRSPNSGQGTAHAAYGPINWRVEGGGANAAAPFNSDDSDVCIGQETTVRLQVDGDRLRFYADERRLASVPNAKFLRGPGLVVSLGGRDDAANAVYVTRIRVAGGGGAVPVASAPPAASTPIPTDAPAGVTSAPPGTTSTATVTAAPTATTATTAPVPTTVAAHSGETSTAATSTTASQATLGGTTPTAMDAADRNRPAALPLSAPTGLAAKYVGGGRYTFTWNVAAGASELTEYELWLKSSQCPSYCRLSLPGLTDTTYVPPPFEFTGAMEVHVKAVEADREPSPNSAPLALEPTPRYKGVYRVTVTGFRVNEETTDNPLEIDGKRDEVLVRAWANLYGPGGLIGSSAVESKVHGDRNADAWSLANSPAVRIKAGSASALGGLRTGDVHRAQPGTPPNTISFPLMVWEGTLQEGENALVIVPTIWEVDRAPAWQPVPLPEPERDLIAAVGQYAAARFVPGVTQAADLTTEYLTRLRRAYRQQLDAIPDWALRASLRARAIRALALLPSASMPVDSVDEALVREATRIRTELGDMGGPEALELSEHGPAVQQRVLEFYAKWAPALAALLNNADRPIGIYSKDGSQAFRANLVHLDFRAAEFFIAGGHGLPPGELELTYTDRVFGSAEGFLSNGSYTLYLRVERLQ
jgi:hypothetical protein